MFPPKVTALSRVSYFLRFWEIAIDCLWGQPAQPSWISAGDEWTHFLFYNFIAPHWCRRSRILLFVLVYDLRERVRVHIPFWHWGPLPLAQAALLWSPADMTGRPRGVPLRRWRQRRSKPESNKAAAFIKVVNDTIYNFWKSPEDGFGTNPQTILECLGKTMRSALTVTTWDLGVGERLNTPRNLRRKWWTWSVNAWTTKSWRLGSPQIHHGPMGQYKLSTARPLGDRTALVFNLTMAVASPVPRTHGLRGSSASFCFFFRIWISLESQKETL